MAACSFFCGRLPAAEASRLPEDTGEGPGSAKMRLLVPAYFYPAGKGLACWEKLFEASSRIPVVAIVNPANGPGEKADANYIRIFERAAESRATLIGYVHSSYAKRPIEEVKRDIDDWISLYPCIQGIFIDEQASAGKDVDYYSELYKYIRKTKGLQMVVSNPGTVCAEEYFSTSTADAICLHESPKEVEASFWPEWTSKYPQTGVLILKYGVTVAEEMSKWMDFAAEKGFGWIYVTDDKGKNPWDRLPAYWGTEADEVQRINSTRRK